MVGVVLVIRAVSDDSSNTSDAADSEAQRRTAGARTAGRIGGRGRSRADEVLEADARYVALRNRARAILVDYLPGGNQFDADCYRRAVARYDRIAQPG